ncbi:MAG: hypothetical protein IPI84_03145 [Holophagaceae bacterium]|nr:hypothetical protein [Holophagaceae bacterium]
MLVTLPLGRAGRHSDFVDLRPLASAFGILVIESHQINSPECLENLRSLALDHLFVIGWSQIFGPDLLSIPKSGSVGYHPTRLPECRGRAVLPWTILLRKRTTGSTLFWLDEDTDSGDIIGQECFEVAEDETSATLYEKHMEVLDRLVFQAVKDLAAGQKPAIPQDHSQANLLRKTH